MMSVNTANNKVLLGFLFKLDKCWLAYFRIAVWEFSFYFIVNAIFYINSSSTISAFTSGINKLIPIETDINYRYRVFIKPSFGDSYNIKFMAQLGY